VRNPRAGWKKPFSEQGISSWVFLITAFLRKRSALPANLGNKLIRFTGPFDFEISTIEYVWFLLSAEHVLIDQEDSFQIPIRDLPWLRTFFLRKLGCPGCRTQILTIIYYSYKADSCWDANQLHQLNMGFFLYVSYYSARPIIDRATAFFQTWWWCYSSARAGPSE